MNFKKNLHKAKEYTPEKVNRMIEHYSRKYPIPKYLTFVKKMLENGYEVKIYVARVSKYVFVKKGDVVTKIRFSNHKPIFEKEEENDCDYYVGISHKQVTTTEDLIEKLLSKD